ncbi:TPA: hypothetical protein O7X39_003859 [Salmonella enterica]|nr:hypothetical protein [Salmonella enterica]
MNKKTEIFRLLSFVIIVIPTMTIAGTVQNKIEYNTPLMSRMTAENYSGCQIFEGISTPMPENVTAIDMSETGCNFGTFPPGLESTIEFNPDTDYIKLTATDSGITYTFTAKATSIKSYARCPISDNHNATCTWPGAVTLPLTLSLVNSSARIAEQSVALIVTPGGNSNSVTDQFARLTGNVLIEESTNNYATVIPSVAATDDISIRWITRIIGDQQGDIGDYLGTLTKTGASANPIHYSLPADVLNASFSPDALNQNINVQMSGVKTDAELASIYIFHEQTPCDDSPLCNYNLINASTSIVCGDNNAHLTFNRSCSGSSSTTCENGKIGSITGTWGRVNIDTTCAVTVLIPYE